MKQIRTIISGGLIGTLVSLVGGLCMDVMPTQAMEMSSVVSEDMLTMHQTVIVKEYADNITHPMPMSALHICVVDCVGNVTKTNSVKKFSLSVNGDWHGNITDQSFVLVHDAVSEVPLSSDIAPPIPDILFSVFKKE
ncbi:MAG: hypothetical protein ACSLEX_01210 [Minisyncoccota bacterium]